MRGKLLRTFMAGLMVLSLGTGISSASQIDILVQKLVEKGVLTPGEAQELISETREETRRELAAGKSEAVPSWVQTTKLKGDFRLRHEMDRNKGNVDDNRTRIRVRLGVEAKPNDQTKVALGIATGKLSDPRSTNVTLGQSSASTKNNPNTFKDIILDYAYGEYTPTNWLTLTGGKMKNPLWQPNDLLWDGDINPEGVSAQMSHDLFAGMEIFMNDALFILTENRQQKNSEPYLVAIQPGFQYKVADGVSLKGAVAYYAFNGVRERAAFDNRATNTLDGANYKYDYDSINPSVELGIDEPFGGVVPYLAIFGDYVQNLSLPSSAGSAIGYDYGVKFGAKKVKESGDWQAKLNYATLAKDAWLDIFPDSDRYSGKTGMNAYEASLEYGLGKNASLGIDYYWAENTMKSNGTTSPAQVIQLDWLLKF